MDGYLPTFNIDWIFLNSQKQKTQNHRHIGAIHIGFVGWLPTYILYYLDFQKQPKAENTKPQAFRWITDRATWMATYLHFILTGFSKTAKSRKHKTTGI